MTKGIRTAMLIACLASTSTFGATLALADSGPSSDGTPAASGKQRCDQGRRHGKHVRKHYLEKLAKQLGVTDQQKVKIKGIFKSYREQNKPVVQTLHSEKRNLRALIHSGTADEAAIRTQSAKVAAAEADLAVARGAMAREIQAVLTPDQVAKLKVLMKEREQKMEKFRERRGFMGEHHME